MMLIIIINNTDEDIDSGCGGGECDGECDGDVDVDDYDS